MKLNKNRIVRTIIQSATGAGAACLTAIASDYSFESIIAAVIQFVTTVLIAVLMNIQRQSEEQEDPDE